MVGVAMIFIHQSLVTLNLFQPKCWKKAPFSGPGGGKAKEGGPWKADLLKAQPFQPGKASRLLCGGVRGGGCLVPFIIPLCCFIHGGGTHHTLHCENILTILEQKEEMEYVTLEYETIFSL